MKENPNAAPETRIRISKLKRCYVRKRYEKEKFGGLPVTDIKPKNVSAVTTLSSD